MDTESRSTDDPAVIADRIADRRAELGVSEAELARDAGMSQRYLEVLLRLGPGFDPAGFLHIAAALGLSYGDLLEGRTGMPPGQAPPASRPALLRLTEQECWERLGTHGVGRVALPTRPAPGVFPVNYAVDGRTVVYRTAPGGAAALHDDAPVAFQADQVDERDSSGWSVLISGSAERVILPETIARLLAETAAKPWAGGDRPLWIRIRPETVSGRRITELPGAP